LGEDSAFVRVSEKNSAATLTDALRGAVDTVKDGLAAELFRHVGGNSVDIRTESTCSQLPVVQRLNDAHVD